MSRFRQSKNRYLKILAFFGPAYLISVGYGSRNWATDLAGGSQFGYSLVY
jgi:manganese transport protein